MKPENDPGDLKEFTLAIEWFPDDPADDDKHQRIQDALIWAGASDINVTELKNGNEHVSYIIEGQVYAIDYLGAILDLLPYVRAIDDCFAIQIHRNVD